MKIAPSLVALALACAFAGPGVAQTSKGVVERAGNETKFRVIPRFTQDAPSHPFPAAKAFIDAGKWPDAWKLLASQKVTHPEAEFLKGYVALQVKDPSALALLKHSAEQDHLLAPYAARFGVDAALAARDFKTASDLAARVPVGLPISDDAQWLRIEALRGQNKPDEATVALGAWIDRHGGDSRIPQARLDYARALVKANPAEAARQAYAVLRDAPLSGAADGARDALKGLAKALNASQRTQYNPDAAELKLARWRAMHKVHRSEDVVAELSKAAAKLPAAQWCEGHFLVAHSLTKLRKHADSVGWYAKVVDKCDQGDWRLRALYLGGKARWNAGQRDEARVWFERLWTDYKTHNYADDAMYFAARILEEEGKHAAVAKLVATQTQTYPDGDMAQDATWLEIRRLFDQKAYKAAVARIDALGTVQEPDLYSRGRAHYFRARALELDGQATASADAYAKVIKDYPMSYYALLAFQRLGQASKGPNVCPGAAVCDVDQVANPALGAAPSSDPGGQRAEHLLALGLETLARAEILALEGRLASHPEALWVLADQLDRTGAVTLAHDIARRKVKGWDQAYPHATERRYWEIAFPRPFKDSVEAWAKQRNIPPALIWAIMREESGFNPKVESWANARGLLQLMRPTAERMAKLEAVAFDWDALFDAPTNIRLGSRYLQELGESVGFHPLLMISGYNGGMGNVGRWFKEAKSTDMDLWVEDIPFGQTRNYTKRVLLSFWAYQWLYAEGTVPKFSMDVPTP